MDRLTSSLMQNGWRKNNGDAEVILFHWKKWILEFLSETYDSPPSDIIIYENRLALVVKSPFRRFEVAKGELL